MLTFNKIGLPFAKVVGGKYNDKVISINPSNDGDATDFKKLKIANESKFQLIPNTSIERQIIYVTGPSGSGKSTFCCNFLKEYKKSSRIMKYIYFLLYLKMTALIKYLQNVLR